MAGSKQQFERLISLEDEELGSSDNHDDILVNNDTCQVSMLMSDVSQADGRTIPNDLEGMFRDARPKRPCSQLPGLSFTINGRLISMSPDQLKYLSLMTLTVQNAALNLTMRAARTQKDQFSTPVAVTIAEILKLITCIGLVWHEQPCVSDAVRTLRVNVIGNYKDTLKVAVPSFVYYVQNNLLYVGSTNLDAATSQVTYQLKILTTAIFSVLMLNKKLSKTQWIALFALFIGVALIETVAVSGHSSKDDPTIEKFVADDDPTGHRKHVEKPLLGFMAILIACCLSGFAGVYFEKILKDSAHVSLWIRNVQLSAATVPIGLIQVLMFERENTASKGLLHGFTPLTWICILLQVQGGLLVAVVVKFANNILKGFATSMAIMISTVASIFLFDFNLTPNFVFGAALVISSVMMYNRQ